MNTIFLFSPFLKRSALLLFLLFYSSSLFSQSNTVSVGADRLFSEYRVLLEGKRIGLVTNQTAVFKNGTHLADSLFNSKFCTLSALFAPEHGIRGDASAGETIASGIDPVTGVQIFSLFGKVKEPTAAMLKNIDVLLFDIQDIGARFYTYISTLFYVIKAGMKYSIPVIVLDRPNPIGGVQVDGPVRSPELSSFVGIAPIPILHGMTVGELALFFTEEGLIQDPQKDLLTVIPCQGWKRDSHFPDWNTRWIKPSPNIPNFETALIYPGTCLIEGTNVSEGRGTEEPFLTIGAPFIDSAELIAALNAYALPGLSYSPVSFTPRAIEGVASAPKWKGVNCNGIFVSVTDTDLVQPVRFGIILISVLHALYPVQLTFDADFFDLLAGTTSLRTSLLKDTAPVEIFRKYNSELEQFKLKRNNYLLY